MAEKASEYAGKARKVAETCQSRIHALSSVDFNVWETIIELMPDLKDLWGDVLGDIERCQRFPQDGIYCMSESQQFTVSKGRVQNGDLFEGAKLCLLKSNLELRLQDGRTLKGTLNHKTQKFEFVNGPSGD